MSTASLEERKHIQKVETSIRKCYPNEIKRLTASMLAGAGLTLPTSLKACGHESLEFFDVLSEAARVESRPTTSERELVASAASGGSLPSVVTSDAVQYAVMAGFAVGDEVSAWTFAGSNVNYKEEFRTVVEELTPPATHARAGTAKHAEIRVLNDPEGIRLGRFSQQLFIDEQDEIDAAPVIVRSAAALGRSVQALIADLAFGLILAGTMDDGVEVCHSSKGNREAGKALDAQTLAECFAAMRQQQSDSARNLYANVNPTALVVGSAKYLPALQVADTFSRVPFSITESPRIDSGTWDSESEATIAGSPGSWFLIDPRRAVERCFLNGEDKPTVARWVRQGEEGQWGTGWAVSASVVLKAIDRRCIFRRDP